MIRSFGKANENDSGSSPFDLFDIMFGELFRNYEMLRRKTRTEKGIEPIYLPVPLLILRRKRVQVAATHSRRKGLHDRGRRVSAFLIPPLLFSNEREKKQG